MSTPIAFPRFGRRRITPQACVLTGRSHLRAFLGEALAELGFVVRACADDDGFAAAAATTPLDLVVLPLPDGPATADRLRRLAVASPEASVLLLGPPASPALAAAQELAAALGLTALTPLATPFRPADLAARVAHLAPRRATLQAPVDIEEALAAGWLEPWYQPQVDLSTGTIRRAEALLRLRHPVWGVIEPARFLPSGADLPWRAVSDLVVDRAIADWRGFAARGTPIGLAVNVPLTVLREPDFVRSLWRRLPDHPAFRGLTVEVDCSEVVAHLDEAVAIARELRFCNVGVSIDDAGPGWTPLAALPHFPFVELKADGGTVRGCATDAARHAVCAALVEQARRVRVPIVAEGVEGEEDLAAVKALGFDSVQGFVVARPMEARKLARLLARQDTATTRPPAVG
ncbi:EAL domain-containing protein [Rhodoplanes azumiensis]|uniref:EAL domain-containing protein n=1 Tax=Rhodoplanes azumiensis TaxID=1897628 RepID=A0ABW5AGW7_9BRAD